MEQDGRNIVQQSMGGVLQDSLNEMGVKQAANAAVTRYAGDHGGLGGLQKAIRTNGTTGSRTSRTSAMMCNRVTALETQRKDLLKALK